MSLRLTSYNIHRCQGRDGHRDPERIRQILREIDAQVMALQEVELLHDEPHFLDQLCADRPWRPLHGKTLSSSTGHYGNALLTSLPILRTEQIDLSFPGREPRGALRAQLQGQEKKVDLIATHLGLRPIERRQQIRRLLEFLTQSSGSDISILLGDLNEWFLWGRPLRWLQSYFRPTPAPATYPAHWPLFALDRIWVHPVERLRAVKVYDSPLARVASDHLPLVATLD